MNRLSEFLSEHIGIDVWVASLIAIVVVTLIVNRLVVFALRHAHKVTGKTASVWDDAVLDSAGGPLRMGMWVISATFMARVLEQGIARRFVSEVLAFRDVILIACVTWFLLRLTGRVCDGLIARSEMRKEGVDRTTVDALGKLARLLILAVAGLMGAQTLGFQITGLLALGGVGGIAVGFAAKDLLANFFGGLTIYLDRPFSVGDWIRSPDKSIEGTVEYISWRHTRIRAFNKNPIYVPNSVFTSIVVENPSRMSHRRIKETIGLRYDDFAQVATIAEEIKQMLRGHDGIDTSQTLIVNFNQFAASSLDLMIYTFTKTTVWVDYHEVKQDVLLRVGEIVARHGAEIAFTTQTLHLEGLGARGDRAAPVPS